MRITKARMARKKKGKELFERVRSRQNQGNVTCIIQFGEQPRVSSINPLKLTIIINRSIGNIDFAKVLSDGKLLVGETKRKEEEKKKRRNRQGCQT